ncbi:phage tail assembly chaperone [Lysinibacillus sp. 3P01SB]|uniref:phage tail assembly chaperone n=1 Tax=Lysinibacillus sp. 3P01SB TaxID=3132284 RepID=UPI0039A58A2E
MTEQLKERKVLSLKELIQNKVKYERKDGGELKTLHVDRLSSDIVIEVPSKDVCMDTIDMTKDEEQAKKADEYIVYTVMREPNLKDSELQKAYECAEPMDIVGKLFTPGEITDISNLAFDAAGFSRGSVSVVKELKN